MIGEFLVPIRSGVTPVSSGRLDKDRAADLLRRLDDLARFRGESFAALFAPTPEGNQP